MHKACLIRTVTHAYNAHNPLPIMTGFTGGRPRQLRPEPTDPPDIGAICQYLGLGPRDLPGRGLHAVLSRLGRAGLSGRRRALRRFPRAASTTRCSPSASRPSTASRSVQYYDPVCPMGDPTLPALDALPDMTADRLDRRRSLLGQLDDAFERRERIRGASTGWTGVQQRAFALLTSSKMRDAFDLAREPDRRRADRYGRNLSGSSLLVARRLVEAGVPFISVHAEIFGRTATPTTCTRTTSACSRTATCRCSTGSYPALLEDLDGRGLLDSTLVVVMGEMGRSPRVNAKAGRDHWPQCGFCLLTGGGIKPGTGLRRQRQARAPTRPADPVSPADLVATIYHLLGIDPHMTVPDRTGRPMPIAHGGEPIRGVIL